MIDFFFPGNGKSSDHLNRIAVIGGEGRGDGVLLFLPRFVSFQSIH